MVWGEGSRRMVGEGREMGRGKRRERRGQGSEERREQGALLESQGERVSISSSNLRTYLISVRSSEAPEAFHHRLAWRAGGWRVGWGMKTVKEEQTGRSSQVLLCLSPFTQRPPLAPPPSHLPEYPSQQQQQHVVRRRCGWGVGREVEGQCLRGRGRGRHRVCFIGLGLSGVGLGMTGQ